MTIKKIPFSALSPKQREDITALISRCMDYEKLSLDLPSLDDEGGVAYLAYEKKSDKAPSSVLFAYDLGEAMEVTAFTEPKKRCRGLFTSLLQHLLDEKGEMPLCFYTDGYSYDALMALQTIEAEYAGTEHLMCLDVLPDTAAVQGPVAIREAADSELPFLADIHSSAFEVEREISDDFLAAAAAQRDRIYAICLWDQPEQPIGLFVASASAAETCLYGFSIKEEERGKGYATAALSLWLAQEKPKCPITLHVSEENEAAFRLYTRAGFVSAQELMEYWY